MKALVHPTWGWVIYALLGGVVVSFPVCCWGPEWLYKASWIVLTICCWLPVLIIGWVERSV